MDDEHSIIDTPDGPITLTNLPPFHTILVTQASVAAGHGNYTRAGHETGLGEQVFIVDVYGGRLANDEEVRAVLVFPISHLPRIIERLQENLNAAAPFMDLEEGN